MVSNEVNKQKKAIVWITSPKYHCTEGISNSDENRPKNIIAKPEGKNKRINLTIEGCKRLQITTNHWRLMYTISGYS